MLIILRPLHISYLTYITNIWLGQQPASTMDQSFSLTDDCTDTSNDQLALRTINSLPCLPMLALALCFKANGKSALSASNSIEVYLLPMAVWFLLIGIYRIYVQLVSVFSHKVIPSDNAPTHTFQAVQ